MNRLMNRLSSIASVTLVTGVVLSSYPTQARADFSDRLRYRVTIRNGTAGNVLSPPLVVVHRRGFGLFAVGRPASAGIATIAETGDTSILEGELAGNNAVLAVVKADGGPVPAGEVTVVEFEVSRAEVLWGARLNFASMIGRSNDSFVSTGHGIYLAGVERGRPFVVRATNFDAGSEENTGILSDFGAGGHPTAQAEGRVSYDRGLNPRGDAPDILSWGPIAATVAIQRLR